MITEKGKRELSPRDQKVLNKILSKAPDVLSEGELGHLTARRMYLSAESLKEYGIKEGKSERTGGNDGGDTDNTGGEDNGNDGEADKADYSELKKVELIAEAEKRNIDLEGITKNAEIIELLELDDQGKLEEA